MTDPTGTSSRKHARIVVVGATRPRIAKVTAVLQAMECEASKMDNLGLTVEYVPCVASFDSYEGEHGKNVRYLISVNYHGSDAMQKSGASLAPIFDKDQEERSNYNEIEPDKSEKNFGIIGMVIGAGIEDMADVERIKSFFQIFRGEETEELPIQVVEPNPEFATMKDETDAFKALDEEGKKEAVRLQTIGPGKMAKIAFDFARSLILELVKSKDGVNLDNVSLDERQSCQTESETRIDESLPTSMPAACLTPPIIDPEKHRYACRKCRTVLFGENDFEDPPHATKQHQFSARKKNHGAAGSSSCQSYFLTDKGLAWMGDMADVEGRFSCPKCSSKIGTWHWAGAQCSCGTWVTPAIQVPKSKVDVMAPEETNATLPPGTVISPHLAHMEERFS